MGKLGFIEVSPDAQRPPASTMQVLGDLELYLTGVIDSGKEKERLQNKQKKLHKEAEKAKIRLENKNFLKRAPFEVVEAEKQKLKELKAQIDLIRKDLASLEES
jgi:valyl-tRNA synthetase